MTRKELEEPLYEALLFGPGSGLGWGYGMVSVLDSIWERFLQGWTDFWAAFPNPLKMLDVFVRFSTSVTGLVIRMPFEGALTGVQLALQRRGVANKLIRVDDAVTGFYRALMTSFNQVTMTTENSLFDVVLQGVARRAYHLFKRAKFLLALIKVKDEFDMVTLVRNSWLKKIKLWRFAAIIIAIATFVVAISITIAFFAFPFNWGEFAKGILSQDSKRKRISRRNFQHRVNVRKGDDRNP